MSCCSEKKSPGAVRIWTCARHRPPTEKKHTRFYSKAGSSKGINNKIETSKNGSYFKTVLKQNGALGFRARYSLERKGEKKTNLVIFKCSCFNSALCKLKQNPFSGRHAFCFTEEHLVELFFFL